jgi:small subunit ribosomal protein S9
MTTAPQHQQYYTGTGRRKSSIAQVRLAPGGGGIVINGKPLEEAIPFQPLRVAVLEPFRVSNTAGRFNAVVKVTGGGVASQTDAIQHGLARALVALDEGLKPVLRKAGLITRDPRIKERKKYGLKRARKAPQYTKR